ncbi:hypothetical protein [Acinetobacter bereziniae]|nr:hypothetical protein [Acinetobacter bereziniae]
MNDTVLQRCVFILTDLGLLQVMNLAFGSKSATVCVEMTVG